MIHRILSFFMVVVMMFLPLSSYAGDDLALATTITGTSIKSNGVVKGQISGQMLTATQHIWLRDGVHTPILCPCTVYCVRLHSCMGFILM